AQCENLRADRQYSLRARVRTVGTTTTKEFATSAFGASDLKNGRIELVEKWLSPKLWDIHTPENILSLELSLLDAGGNALDDFWPRPFGFRELWIEGRDFFLNGTR